MKKKIHLIIAAVALASLPFIVQAASWTIANWKGTATRWNTTEFEIQSATEGGAASFLPGTNNTNPLGSSTLGFSTIYTNALNLMGTGPSLQFGAGTVVSTTNTSGTSFGSYFTAYLGAATNALEGSVLCATTPVAGQGVTVQVCPATTDLTTWVGVAKAAASTGSVVNVYGSGWVLALASGTVNAGDVLTSSSAVAGYLYSDTTPTTGADVATALGTNTTGSSGLVRVRLR